VAYVAVNDSSAYGQNGTKGLKPLNGYDESGLSSPIADGDPEKQTAEVLSPEDQLEKQKRTRRALCCSLVTLLLSIPALIGA